MGVWSTRYGRPSKATPDDLRARLDQLLAEARKNEHKMRRFQALELKLIGLHSLHELIRTLLYPDRSQFDWDMVSLVLIDTDYGLRRALEGNDELLTHPRLNFVDNDLTLQSLYPPLALTPILGQYKAAAYQHLFDDEEQKPKSVMLLPLARQGRLIGSFNIGSLEETRFSRGYRTDFLKHLTAVISICLENALNMQRVQLLGITDTLSGTNNRRYFDQRLEEEIELSRRNHQPLGCLMIDIDHFKRVNDTYGHQSGDETIKLVAKLAKKEIRGSDVLARYGGEEFVALLVRTDTSAAIDIAERIRTSIERQTFKSVNGEIFPLTISAGISTTANFMGGALNGEDLVAFADKALYEAKQKGRNQVVAA